MGIFDKLKQQPQKGEQAEEINDLPTLEKPPTLADAVRSARELQRDFRGRENDTPNVSEDEGIPSVNRGKGGNKLITALGFLFILGAAAALIVSVNGPKKKTMSSEERQAQNEQVSNRLPPIAFPSAPPPIQTTPTGQVPPIKPGADAKPIGVVGGNKPGAPMAGVGNGKLVMTWEERKVAGGLLVPMQNTGQSYAQPKPAAPVVPASNEAQDNGGAALPPGGGNRDKGDLAAKLEPTVMKGASASTLPNRNFLITKGTTLDCILQTALDSTLPGLTTCQLTRDVYSNNGHVLLLDRGSKLVGEYQGGVKQGQARIFVLWSRVETPKGVVISLNSPGTDALGRSGLAGWVDTHFAERFGAAIMFSLMKDTFAYLAASQQDSGGGGTVVYGNTQGATEQLAGKALDSTINIPPTLYKNQGEHIQVIVARDLDFSSVYGLQVRQ
jgi:type IV secretion system protein VirB10